MNLIDIITPEIALGFAIFAVIVCIANVIYVTIISRKIIKSANKLLGGMNEKK